LIARDAAGHRANAFAEWAPRCAVDNRQADCIGRAQNFE
jgi:hypothetical protein